MLSCRSPILLNFSAADGEEYPHGARAVVTPYFVLPSIHPTVQHVAGRLKPGEVERCGQLHTL